MGDRRPETKPRKISLKIEEEEREMEDGSDQGCQCQNQPQQKAIPIPAPANSQSRVGNRIDVPMAAIQRAKQLIKQVRKNSMLRESQTKLTFLGTEAAETDNEAKEEQWNENGESGDDGGGVEKQQHKTLVTRL